MIKIGLTGGIGSGKSTVSFMLKEAGFEVVDADVIAKEVLVKYPEILEKVKIEFGSGFFDWRGEFRRKEFGNHIFRFPKQRKKYEEIILPYIKNEIKDTLNKLEENKTKTKIELLNEEQTLKEIARIASGKITKETIEHAKILRGENKKIA